MKILLFCCFVMNPFILKALIYQINPHIRIRNMYLLHMPFTFQPVYSTYTAYIFSVFLTLAKDSIKAIDRQTLALQKKQSCIKKI